MSPLRLRVVWCGVWCVVGVVGVLGVGVRWRSGGAPGSGWWGHGFDPRLRPFVWCVRLRGFGVVFACVLVSCLCVCVCVCVVCALVSLPSKLGSKPRL